MSKKFFEFVLSLLLLFILSPLFPVIAVLVKLSSPGPIIYRQKRVGRFGAPFTILKFRTMVDGSGSGKLSDLVTEKNDPRVTRAGRFLRKTHLDELPQLWNVLRGEMSLIGPRPTSLEITEIRRKEIPGYDKRFEIQPGITGLVQTRKNYRRTKANLRKYLALELFYIKHHCLFLDLKILARTVVAVCKGRGI